MNQEMLKEYAKLLVEVGLNLAPGQTMVLRCPVDCAPFARLCTEAAYAAGAREVVLRWNDEKIQREYYLHAADELFDHIPAWQQELMNGYAKEGAAFLSISARDPEAYLGVDPERLLRVSRANGRDLGEFHRRVMANKNQWCVASVPVAKWSAKVFPGLDAGKAEAKLWEAICKAVRITGEGNAVELWREHEKMLKARLQKLNDYHFKTLHYTNALGTDLTVELPEHHLWAGGSSQRPDGRAFIANMPTEEIFTSPLKGGTNGVVYASMPLVIDGNIVDKFHFVVRDGKIVEAHAEVGEDILKNAISADEGACYFGEMALVPYDSPIRNQNILFYNTLFDENAACHIAFGDSYPECIAGGEDMELEDLLKEGVNHSDTHEDFMIGTADLSIVGTTYAGEEIPVFVNGNFAF